MIGLQNNKIFRVFHHIDQRTIDEFFRDYSPVFVLSTGRSGSKFIHHILSQVESLTSYHEPPPMLMYFSNFAYHNKNQPELLKAMFLAARLELLLASYNEQKTYIESNQCMTFFAPAIKDVFQNVRFIHLVRQPGDFIRSAVMKGWHLNDSIWESGRVRMQDCAEWDKLNQIERLAWVWVTTNAFIKSFLECVESDKTMTVRLEDISRKEDSIIQILRFLGSNNEISTDRILQLQSNKVNELHIHNNEPPNMKKMISYPRYTDWAEQDKELVRRMIGSHSSLYGYEI